jgi:cell division protease FtsH
VPTGTYLEVTATDRPFAEGTQRRVDREVARLLREAEARATELLVDHQAALDALTRRLLDEETLDGSVVYDVLVDPDAPPLEQATGDGADAPGTRQEN